MRSCCSDGKLYSDVFCYSHSSKLCLLMFASSCPTKENGKAPNLRTVNILRVSPAGFDMIFKAGGATAQKLLSATPVSLLHTQGRFVPGESAEQYRGEGTCVPIPLTDLQAALPLFTLTGMMASRRWAAETGTATESRAATGAKTHWTQILQQTRQDLENDRISMEEIEQCVQAVRFRPERLEYMAGAPGAYSFGSMQSRVCVCVCVSYSYSDPVCN